MRSGGPEDRRQDALEFCKLPARNDVLQPDDIEWREDFDADQSAVFVVVGEQAVRVKFFRPNDRCLRETNIGQLQSAAAGTGPEGDVDVKNHSLLDPDGDNEQPVG